MSRYTALIDWAIPAPKPNTFEVTTPIIWEVGRLGSGMFVTVAAGFWFDVSTPACLRWFVRPDDPAFLKAAALHDYALSMGWDRVSAAALFSEALRADGVGKIKRLLCVLGVIIWHWR